MDSCAPHSSRVKHQAVLGDHSDETSCVSKLARPLVESPFDCSQSWNSISELYDPQVKAISCLDSKLCTINVGLLQSMLQAKWRPVIFL